MIGGEIDEGEQRLLGRLLRDQFDGLVVEEVVGLDAFGAEILCIIKMLDARRGVESARASIRDATARAFLEAFLGTTTNAIRAAMNTTPPTIPNTRTRRRAFLARAAIQR